MAGFDEIGGFDANKVDPNILVIPAGDYDAVITESKFEPTKNGNGKFLTLKLQILSGQFQNRVLFDRLNLINPSEQAVQIAKGQLSAICRAVGVLTPKDSAELHNRPLKITVKVKSDANNPGNEIKAYKSRHAGPATSTSAPAAPTPQQPAATATPYQAPVASGQAAPW